MSGLAKSLAENQREMLKLIAPTTKKQTVITASEETDSESENVWKMQPQLRIKLKPLRLLIRLPR